KKNKKKKEREKERKKERTITLFKIQWFIHKTAFEIGSHCVALADFRGIMFLLPGCLSAGISAVTLDLAPPFLHPLSSVFFPTKQNNLHGDFCLDKALRSLR
ncbi:hypothetical protein ACQP3C_27120, partial [Escherichia coli]